MFRYTIYSNRQREGFSLIEVVLALGIFLVTILALVGLLGPTLQSVSAVKQVDEVNSVVNTVNTFLQTSPDIGDSTFESLYRAIEDDGYATVIVYNWYDDASAGDGPPVIRQEIGFIDNQGGAISERAIVNSGSSANFNAAAGQIYRIILLASSVTPEEYIEDNGVNTYVRYTLNEQLASYPLGYFVMEARIYALEDDMNAISENTIDATDVAALQDEEAAFTYPIAITR